MGELDDFRADTLARQTEAMRALFSGDQAPFMSMWSTRDPLSLFGAWGSCTTGSAELNRVYQWVGSRFSRCGDLSFDVEVVDIVGDLAYTVGCERFTASVDGRPAEPMTIRVTHVYRREDGTWKIVHRHGDWAPVDEGPPPP
ncbi:nuclear transport factor 2 family protein [Nonomuraea sp. C10]|uniref:YybH family protein n=1 Tax=Nonomuraea sp. C10 TaxID=2600577 RepID=UPI0011CED0B2|nr:nuclear transport factor 2 family protein [Nonomuraea sp. C10]TXK39001.1 nuclear transport factor 2 family protein [Nonomuraea sp. C10]